MTASKAESKFVWCEYVGGDAAKAQGFFGEVLHWGTQAAPMPQGVYTMISIGGRTIGGYSNPPGAKPGPTWLSHLLVTDARATAAKITELGGKVLKAPFAVGDFGTMAVVTDPHGGAFALWQPAKVEAEAEPVDGAFCWSELYSVDPAASVAFYVAIGGFTAEAMDMPGMGAYHVLKTGDVPRAGILARQMPEQPHAWLPYVQVANADKTHERAKQLGGTSLVPPTTVPTVGRFAIFVDPQGAPLGILQPEA